MRANHWWCCVSEWVGITWRHCVSEWEQTTRWCCVSEWVGITWWCCVSELEQTTRWCCVSEWVGITWWCCVSEWEQTTRWCCVSEWVGITWWRCVSGNYLVMLCRWVSGNHSVTWHHIPEHLTLQKQFGIDWKDFMFFFTNNIRYVYYILRNQNEPV